MELFDPHGGYRKLDSFTLTTIAYLATIRFCNTFLNLRNDPKGRLYDQMVQAARSGRANIMEGSARTSTSKETEIKLVDVARASLVAANAMLDHQMNRLGGNFRESGGFRERMSAVRIENRNAQVDPEAPACPECAKPMRVDFVDDVEKKLC